MDSPITVRDSIESIVTPLFKGNAEDQRRKLYALSIFFHGDSAPILAQLDQIHPDLAICAAITAGFIEISSQYIEFFDDLRADPTIEAQFLESLHVFPSLTQEEMSQIGDGKNPFARPVALIGLMEMGYANFAVMALIRETFYAVLPDETLQSRIIASMLFSFIHWDDFNDVFGQYFMHLAPSSLIRISRFLVHDSDLFLHESTSMPPPQFNFFQPGPLVELCNFLSKRTVYRDRELAQFIAQYITSPLAFDIHLRGAHDLEPSVRSHALTGLKKYPIEQTLELFCLALKDTKGDVREIALSVLEKQPTLPASAVPGLIECLVDSSYTLRNKAVWLLGEIHPPEAYEKLLKIYQEPFRTAWDSPEELSGLRYAMLEELHRLRSLMRNTPGGPDEIKEFKMAVLFAMVKYRNSTAFETIFTGALQFPLLHFNRMMESLYDWDPWKTVRLLAQNVSIIITNDTTTKVEQFLASVSPWPLYLGITPEVLPSLQPILIRIGIKSLPMVEKVLEKFHNHTLEAGLLTTYNQILRKIPLKSGLSLVI